MRNALFAAALMTSACGLFGTPDLRLDEADGIPNISGNQEVQIPPNFQCGTPITSNGVTVQTQTVTGGCQFTLDQDIEVLKASDYSRLPAFTSAGARFVQKVEITLTKLDFTDNATGTKLDLQTRVTSATFSVNGQQLADKAALATLPKTFELTGAALDPIKAKVEARQPASVQARAIAVLPNTPAPPARLGITYEAKPAIILGL